VPGQKLVFVNRQKATCAFRHNKRTVLVSIVESPKGQRTVQVHFYQAKIARRAGRGPGSEKRFVAVNEVRRFVRMVEAAGLLQEEIKKRAAKFIGA